MRYRRLRVAGASYFFTVNLADRSGSLLVDHIDHLRACVQRVKSRHPFEIDAMVVLPEHLHAVWTLPPDDADYSMRWSLIKANFSRGIKPGERLSKSRQKKGERGIWQRRFWEHLIRNERDYKHHIEYIHDNPVKHGYVTHPKDWPYSTYHKNIGRLG